MQANSALEGSLIDSERSPPPEPENKQSDQVEEEEAGGRGEGSRAKTACCCAAAHGSFVELINSGQNDNSTLHSKTVGRNLLFAKLDGSNSSETKTAKTATMRFLDACVLLAY